MADHDEQPRKRIRLEEPNDDTVLDRAVAAQLEQERKYGITAFATSELGFSGIVKQRYTDFLVNEIATSGKVLHLEKVAPSKSQSSETNGAKPVQETAKVKSEASVVKPEEAYVKAEEPVVQAEESTVKAEGDNENKAAAPAMAPGQEQDDVSVEQRREAAVASISAEDVKLLEDIFGSRTAQATIQLYSKIVARPTRKARDFPNLQSDPIQDKQKRTDAHIAVRRIFEGKIDTVTGDENSILIKAAPGRPKAGGARAQGAGPKVKGKIGWDELGGEYLHFTLYKENKDTMEVLGFLASQMKLQMKNFQMAGTKDRRGVTVQGVSVYRVTKEKMESFIPRLRQASLSSFKYKSSGLQLGDLQGNEFVITLRDIRVPTKETQNADQRLTHARATITQRMQGFQSRGFINHYGLQRFGTFATSTDEIGRRMLQGNLKGAVSGLLAFTDTALAEALNPTPDSKISADDKARAQAIDIWNRTHKAGTALEKLPRKFQAETSIIKYLGWSDRKSGQQRRLEDFHGALMQIARNLRLMYVHAYQSLVWNSAAALRWETFGDMVVEGDLVLVREHADKKDETKAEEEDVDDEGEVIVRPATDDSATAQEDIFERARPLTKQEVASGAYSIFDVVLPLPGFDVVYPSNDIGKFYTEFMAKDNLDPYKMRRTWKDISLSGSYRKVMARPNNVSFEVKSYTKEEEQLVQTDMERLKAEEGDKMEVDAANGTEANDAPSNIDPKIALLLRMQLGSSQYATIALRELTKGGALGFKPDYSGR